MDNDKRARTKVENITETDAAQNYRQWGKKLAEEQNDETWRRIRTNTEKKNTNTKTTNKNTTNKKKTNNNNNEKHDNKKNIKTYEGVEQLEEHLTGPINHTDHLEKQIKIT